jgi:AraC-like DNA-binding protein
VTGEVVKLPQPFYAVVDCINGTGLAGDFDSLFYHFYYGSGPLSRNYCSVLLEKIVFDLFAVSHKMLKDDGEIDPRIRRVMQFLNGNPENRLNTSEIAAMAGMSADYFSRFFKKSTGMSLKHFQVSSRLRHAHYLLEFSDMRVNEIAVKLNYADAYIFSKQFKAFYGISPKDVRKGKA